MNWNNLELPDKPYYQDDETLRLLYTTMIKIRRVEEKIAEILSSTSEIICPVHLYTGQEAIAVGICANLRKDDYVFSTHRSHGHYLAKGGGIKELMAELYGKVTGCSKGRGGSMHLASPNVGLLGSSAIVAGTVPLAVGTALASSLEGQDTVSVVFFGDGVVSEGVFYESLNFASLKKLPVIFICENNLYATHMPVSECLADTNIYKKAEVFNIPSIRIDGNNVIEVFRTAKRAIEHARHGNGSALIECMTYRWLGHVGSNNDSDKGLRPKEELDYWMNRCPIKTLEEFLLEHKTLSNVDKTKINDDINKEIEEAITFAKESPYPNENELLDNVFKT